jgi:hypothetical protein
LFYRQLEEAKRLTRRMGDCFSFETIDMTTTHVIIPDDDPQITLTLDLLLALIYGWLVLNIESFLFYTQKLNIIEIYSIESISVMIAKH